MGNNQCPKTFHAALDVLSNHKLDQKYYKQCKQDKDKIKNDAKQEDTNPSLDAPSNAQKSKEYRCYCCGSRDHDLKKCPELKTRPRDCWWAEKHMNNAQQDADDSGTDNDQTVNSASQLRRSGSRARNTNNNNSPRIEWNALQNAYGFLPTTHTSTNDTS